MNIDWSKAPEGATHYREPGGMYYGGFYKQSPEGWFFFVDASWEHMETPDKSDSNPLIPRPTKPAAPEYPRIAIMVNPYEAPLHYGEEAIGKEIEVIEWLPDESCYVVRFDWGLGVLHDSMVDFGLYDIRTAEQRQMDELTNFLGDLLTAAGWEPDMRDAGDLADAILSRYSLEPKQ